MTDAKPAVIPFMGLRPAPSATRPRDQRPGVAGLDPDALAAWCVAHDQPAYRARQVLDAVWRGGQQRFEEILTLPAPLRDRARRRASLRHAIEQRDPRHRRRADREGAAPPVDGRLVESVLMHYPARDGSRERHTLCISQPGGVRRGLPVLRDRGAGHSSATSRRPRSSTRFGHAARRLAADGRRLTNVVFMGMGEPLLNLDRVLDGDRGAQRSEAVRAGRPAHHRLHVRGGARDPAAGRDRARSSRSRSASMPRATRCATCWCRSTAAGRSQRWLPRRASTRRPRAAGDATRSR